MRSLLGQWKMVVGMELIVEVSWFDFSIGKGEKPENFPFPPTSERRFSLQFLFFFFFKFKIQKSFFVKTESRNSKTRT